MVKKTKKNLSVANNINLTDNKIVLSLQKIAKNPTTTGVLEFLTGVGATAIDKPGNLFISGGRLAQAVLKGSFVQQLYDDVQSYREIGKIPDQLINSHQGKAVFIELMKTLDEENLDENKYKALKTIFLNTVWVGADEHKQMLGYQYFLICRRLSSFDILLLKLAFSIYRTGSEVHSRRTGAGWDAFMAKKLNVPVQLVIESRLQHSTSASTSHDLIFEHNVGSTKHGLSELGIAIGQFLSEPE